MQLGTAPVGAITSSRESSIALGVSGGCGALALIPRPWRRRPEQPRSFEWHAAAEPRHSADTPGGRRMTDERDRVEEPWGVRLRRWRDETMQWSQRDLVDHLVQLAFESKEERGTLLDVRLVS